MTKRTRRDRLSKWDDGENPLNDDQDDYISERSSIDSVEGHFRGPDGNTAKQQQPQNQQDYQQQQQQQYQDPYLNGEGPHTLRYFYNELPTEGVPAATIAKESKKEEKKRLKEEIKARRGQGQLVQGPDAVPTTEMNDNYYPYWYYYKAKNPDWIMRQQQYTDAPFMPPPDPTTKIDLTEPENLPAEPKLTLAQRKARQFQYGDRGTPDIKFNRFRRRYEMLGEGGTKTGDDEDGKKGTSSRQYIPLKDGDDEDDPRLRKNGRYSRTGGRGKLQTEYDWAEHYTNYMRNKSSLGNPGRDYKPNIRSRQNKNRKDYDPLRGIYGDDDNDNDDEDGPNGSRKNDYYTSRGRNYSRTGNYYRDGNNNRNGNYNRNNRYSTRSQQDYTNSSTRYGQQGNNQSQYRSNQNRSAPYADQNRSAPYADQNGRYGRSQSQLHSHSHGHGHGHGHEHGHEHGHGINQTGRNNISSKDLTGSGFKVVDASRRGGFGNNRTQNSYGQAPPAIYNQSSFLPAISRDYNGPHQLGYYGTQALTNDYNALNYAPRMHKANAQTKFYDRYLNNVIDKRLFT